jgi:DNA invertase Pin-like site-specific DNA recombinase
MALIGFARVRTIDQDLTSQLQQLQEAGCVRIFHGKQSSASKENKTKLAELIDYIREDDVVLVTALDRLGCSLKQILTTIDRIHKKESFIKSLDGSIDTSNESPFAQATLNLIGIFAQLEQDLIASRTSEGRALAKADGKHMGRPPQINQAERVKIRKSLEKGHSVSSLSRKYSVSRTTISRIRLEVESS